MKKIGVLLICLIILLPISIAKTISVPEVTSSTETNYIYGNSLIAKVEEDNINYYHQDYLGSNRIITNENKEIAYKANNLPFGYTFSEQGEERYKFTGKELDLTNLYYFIARNYNSKIGKFLQVDPLLDSYSYSYANNNPLKYTDPTGMATNLYGKEVSDSTYDEWSTYRNQIQYWDDPSGLEKIEYELASASKSNFAYLYTVQQFYEDKYLKSRFPEMYEAPEFTFGDYWNSLGSFDKGVLIANLGVYAIVLFGSAFAGGKGSESNRINTNMNFEYELMNPGATEAISKSPLVRIIEEGGRIDMDEVYRYGMGHVYGEGERVLVGMVDIAKKQIHLIDASVKYGHSDGGVALLGITGQQLTTNPQLGKNLFGIGVFVRNSRVVGLEIGSLGWQSYGVVHDQSSVQIARSLTSKYALGTSAIPKSMPVVSYLRGKLIP